MDDALMDRPLRAPRTSGAALIEPPLSAAPDMIASAAAQRAASDYDFQGRTLPQLADQARAQLVCEARRYTQTYRDISPVCPKPDRVILAGHQPEIFHPGVWFKNFTLSKLAQQNDAIAVNLVIDSDTIKSASLRVPGGSVDKPTVTAVSFDRAAVEIPYEQRTIIDRALLESFGWRAANRIAPLVPHPFLERYWPLVVERSRETSNLGQCLAQARHQVEGEWGQSTLEIPQSRICQLEAFHWFTAHLLAHLPRFWETYNAAVLEYRRLHHIRSVSHPVPQLATHDEWLEAPFWIWTDADPMRRRLFVTQRNDRVVLTDRRQVREELVLSPDGEAHDAVQQLSEFGRRGIKLRTRALGTTLLARLLLGDVFLHGIGGAKYDQLTDQLIARFFGIEPPGFFVVSATLHLPVERQPVTEDDARQVAQELRETEFHPERFIDPATRNQQPVAELLVAKQRWINTPPTIENARQRCHAIRGVNAALQPWIQDARTQLVNRRNELRYALRAEAILSSRQYGFCLYPEKTLRDLMLGPEANGFAGQSG